MTSATTGSASTERQPHETRTLDFQLGDLPQMEPYLGLNDHNDFALLPDLELDLCKDALNEREFLTEMDQASEPAGTGTATEVPAPSTFPKFGSLPQELQDMIWTEAALDNNDSDTTAGVHVLRIRKSLADATLVESSSPNVALWTTCWASRKIMSKIFKDMPACWIGTAPNRSFREICMPTTVAFNRVAAVDETHNDGQKSAKEKKSQLAQVIMYPKRDLFILQPTGKFADLSLPSLANIHPVHPDFANNMNPWAFRGIKNIAFELDDMSKNKGLNYIRRVMAMVELALANDGLAFWFIDRTAKLVAEGNTRFRPGDDAPPEVVPQFFCAATAGADVVVGYRPISASWFTCGASAYESNARNKDEMWGLWDFDERSWSTLRHWISSAFPFSSLSVRRTRTSFGVLACVKRGEAGTLEKEGRGRRRLEP